MFNKIADKIKEDDMTDKEINDVIGDRLLFLANTHKNWFSNDPVTSYNY